MILSVLAHGGWTAQATATLAVGVPAAIGAGIGLTQKWKADRRQHWWQRTEWALEQLNLNEQARLVAVEVLNDQIGSKLASNDDGHLMEIIMDLVIKKVVDEDEFDGTP